MRHVAPKGEDLPMPMSLQSRRAPRLAPFGSRTLFGGKFRGPDGTVSEYGAAWITTITMFCTALGGFLFQQQLIERLYRGEFAEIHQDVKKIKRLEMMELEQKSGESSGQQWG